MFCDSKISIFGCVLFICLCLHAYLSRVLTGKTFSDSKVFLHEWRTEQRGTTVTLRDSMWNEPISKGNINFDEFYDAVLLDYQPGDVH